MEPLGPDFDTLLTRGALWALAVAAVWGVLVFAAVAVEAWTRGRVRIAHHTGCPAAWRAWLLGLLVALFTGLSPAHAGELHDAGAGNGTGAGGQGGGETGALGVSTIAALDGLPLPDRPTSAPGRPVHRTAGQVVVVRRGDSLWRIARELLPHEDAASSSVATTVQALYAHNRAILGADPDLIRPGQRLQVPDALTDFPDPSHLPEER